MSKKNFNSKSNKLNFDYLNNLNFNEVDTNKFSSIKILKLIPRKNSALRNCNGYSKR